MGVDDYADDVVFSDNIKGINNFSIYYHNKELNALSDKEILELILILRVSSYYDKKKHPEKVEEAVEEAMKQLKL